MYNAEQVNFMNIEAEESLIAALVSGGSTASKEGFVQRLTENDFGVPSNGAIFQTIKTVIAKGQNSDLVTVNAELEKLYPEMWLDLNQRLINIIQTRLGTRANADGYIAIIKELSSRRQTIKALQEAVQSLSDPMKELDDIIDQLQLDKLRAASRDSCEWHDMTSIMMSTFDDIERRSRGEIKPITTGLRCVDKIIGGFFGGELTIIGARPSVGKSAFGANIALEAAKDGYKVAIVSREMTDTQFGQRLLSRQSGINGMQLRSANLNDNDWSELSEAMVELSPLPIKFIFTLNTVEDLKREVVRMKQNDEIDILVVDYLQLMQTTGRADSEHLRVGIVSRTLKEIALNLNIPVIALAQVNRGTDGQMPTLSSLKDSGSIEQDADGVIFLHRPNSLEDTSINPEDKPYIQDLTEKGFTYLCIGVAKQRQGAIGKTNVLFDAERMTYREIDRGRN